MHNRFNPRAHQPPNLLGLPEFDSLTADRFKAAFDWEELAWLRQITRLPLIVKGILSAEDAEVALQHGVDVVYVSNHGGRELDHAPSSIEVLSEIVGVVGSRAEVIVDSGFMHGTDVVKALCLGARAVLVGKLMTWGLGAGGEAGVRRVLELLRVEISSVMAYLGVRSVAELGPSYVASCYPPAATPWPFTSHDMDPVPPGPPR